MNDPDTLDHAGIAARIPHAGTMCLLDSLLDWNAESLRCRVNGHRDPAHPLRTAGGLLAPVAIEYASQAMALHGSLGAAAGTPPRPGYLVAARGVRLHVARLDDAAAELIVSVTLLAGGEQQALYGFALAEAGGRLLVEGRATVVLNSPLPTSPTP